MTGRIVVFGATGYTGRLVAERLAGAGERPVLAGRSAERLQALADDLGGLETAHGDVMRSNSVFALVERGRRARHHRRAVRQVGRAGRARGDRRAARPTSTRPASRRSSAACSRNHGPVAERAGVAAADRDGLRLRARARWRARWRSRRPGEAAVRVDVGYYALGDDDRRAVSRGTRASLVGRLAGREPRVPRRRAAQRARRPSACARSRSRARSAPRCRSAAPSTSALPAAYPQLRGGQRLPRLVRAVRARRCRPARSSARSPRGVPGRARGADVRRRAAGGAGRGRPTPARRRAASRGSPRRRSTAPARQLAEVHLSGGNWYAFTADFIAWAARAAAGGRVKGTGALGPVEAFGLEELERGCAAAGLSRAAA